MEILIRGGQVYVGQSLRRVDVWIRDGTVQAVGPELNAPAAQVVEAWGGLLAPGFTDLHTHLRQPGYEDKETIATGTAAGAAGGFTTLCAMPNLRPVSHDLQALAQQTDHIAATARVRVLPYASLTVDQAGGCPADIPALAPLVAGFSDDGRGVQREDVLRRAMQLVAAQNGLVAAHCELESLLPGDRLCVQQGTGLAQKLGCEGFSGQSEAAAVERDIRLAAETGCRLHICHVSAAESFAHIRRAKAAGLPVTCEVTPHNLVLSCEDAQDDGRFRMNPPLRTPADRQAARQALLDGTADAVATDHAPHTREEKSGGFAASLNGVVGLETAFPALYTHLVLPGLLPLEKLLWLLAVGPRRVLGLPEDGIRPGLPADMVLLDLQAERLVNPEEFLSKGRSSPFKGMRLRGWPVYTWCGGQLVYKR